MNYDTDDLTNIRDFINGLQGICDDYGLDIDKAMLYCGGEEFGSVVLDNGIYKFEPMV